MKSMLNTKWIKGVVMDKTYGQMDRHMDGWIYIYLDGWTHGWSYRWMDEQMN